MAMKPRAMKKKKMMRNGGTPKTPSAPVRGVMGVPKSMMGKTPSPSTKNPKRSQLGQLNQQMKDLSKADMKALLISMMKGKTKLPNLEKAQKEAEAFAERMRQQVEKAKKAK